MRIEMAVRAETYRLKAEELRAVSAAWPDGQARTILDHVARDYDRMAENLEKHVRSDVCRMI